MDGHELTNIALKASNGDRGSLDVLCLESRCFIRSIVVKMIQDRQLTDDLVQDVYVGIINNIGTFRGNSEYLTWLYRIVNNKCVDYTRKYSRELKANMIASLNNKRAVYQHSNVEIMQLVNMLPDIYKMVINCKLMGMNHLEAARHCGISHMAARGIYRRAIEYMRTS